MFRFNKIFQQVNKPFNIKTFINYKGRGYVPTMLRESVGYSMYFGSYNYLKEQNIPTFIAGGIVGLCNWGASFPFDTIMTRQIAQNISVLKAIQWSSLYIGLWSMFNSFCMCEFI